MLFKDVNVTAKFVYVNLVKGNIVKTELLQKREAVKKYGGLVMLSPEQLDSVTSTLFVRLKDADETIK